MKKENVIWKANSFFLVISFFFCENQIFSYYTPKKKDITKKKNDITKILSKTAQFWPKMMLSKNSKIPD